MALCLPLFRKLSALRMPFSVFCPSYKPVSIWTFIRLLLVVPCSLIYIHCLSMDFFLIINMLKSFWNQKHFLNHSCSFNYHLNPLFPSKLLKKSLPFLPVPSLLFSWCSLTYATNMLVESPSARLPVDVRLSYWSFYHMWHYQLLFFFYSL